MKTEQTCAFCNNKFISSHGNQRYCSRRCKDNQKVVSQHKLYTILKEFRSGFLTNYKLFENLLQKSLSIELPLNELSGFNSFCFYKQLTDSYGKNWYQAGEYKFNIYSNGGKSCIKIIK